MKALPASLPIVLLCFTALVTTPAQESPSIGKIIRLDPAFDELVPHNARVEKVATGFTFTEGPLWRPDGVLWFSDVPGNVVRSLTPAGAVKVIIRDADGTVSAPPGAFIGPNGTA